MPDDVHPEVADAATPWLPEGRTAVLVGRGEVFYRRFQHPDPDAPTLLLLHGWTADADSQFFSAYRTLAERYSFVAIDHRGHGRGMRSNERVTLEALADDAAALVELLGVGPVITIGYSMGGPVSMLLARRHPGLVAGLVLQATALEWRSRLSDRISWWFLVVLGVLLRSSLYPRAVRRYLGRLVGAGNDALGLWLSGEVRRNDPADIVRLGKALSVYDARPWASTLGLPAAVLVTTDDRLVRPEKQRALAAATSASIDELAADHLATITDGADYAAVTRRQVDRLAAATSAGMAVAG